MNDLIRSAEEMLEAWEFDLEIITVLSEIGNPRLYEILFLRYHDNLSMPQIAEKMCIDLRWAKRLRKRACLLFAKKFIELGGVFD